MMFVLSQGLSLFAEELVRFAIPIVYFLNTKDAFGISIIYCCTLTPRIILGPFLGSFSDYFAPKTVFKAGILGQIFLMSIAPFFFASNIFIYGGLAIALSIFNSLRFGAVQSIQPQLFDNHKLMGANGLLTSFESMTLLLPPIFAGFVLEIAGLSLLCSLGIAINLVALIVQKNIKVEARIETHTNLIKSGFSGLHCIIDNRYLFRNLILTCPVNLFLAIALALLIPMIIQNSNNQTFVLGLVIAMGSIGQILGGTCCRFINRHFSATQMLNGGFLLGGLGLLLTGWCPNNLYCMMSFFLLGFGAAVINTSNQTIWQLICPEHLRGGAISTRRSINNLLAPLGFLIAVPLADSLSPLASWLNFANHYSIVFVLCGLSLLLLGAISQMAYSMTNVPKT
jgi:MFS family permease